MPLRAAAAARGVRAVGDVELAGRRTDAGIVAVTGTNGKSTVVRLVTEMLNGAGHRAVECGNVGVPILDVVEDPHAREPQLALEAGELYSAISKLPDDYRDVLVAVDVTGLSYKEAAQALRIREGTVMSRLYRARQQVIRRVEGGST